MPSQITIRRVYKPALFLLCSLPLIGLILGALNLGAFSLGADPIAKILHELGEWALRFIVLTLMVTPAGQLFNARWLVAFRRMIGLFAFFYVLLHFLTWLILDQGLYWAGILPDIAKRPFITIGFMAFLMLIPLAITSTNKMMRKLGRNWLKLHRLVYVIALLGVWHFYWQVKKDIREPLIYAAIVFLLLGWRVWKARQKANAAAMRG
jgi:methionine sulfoxide reductase heme-binding subunit